MRDVSLLAALSSHSTDIGVSLRDVRLSGLAPLLIVIWLGNRKSLLLTSGNNSSLLFVSFVWVLLLIIGLIVLGNSQVLKSLKSVLSQITFLIFFLTSELLLAYSVSERFSML